MDNLSSKKATDLIEYGCQKNQTLRMLKNSIIKNSKGNPLYISEAMNIIFQANKDPFFNLDLETFFNSKNVSQLYSIQLSAFNDVRQEIFRAASVIGKIFTIDDLFHLVPYYKHNLSEILKDLSRKKFIIEIDEGAEYSFVHDKQRDSIYQDIDLIEKQAWHIALGQKYKKLRKYEVCAYHFYHGDNFYESIPYLSYSARKLLKQAQPKRAEFYFLKAF